MPGRPNFDVERVTLRGENVIVHGSSEAATAAEAADIVGITVYLAQGDRIDEVSASKNNPWVATFDKQDPNGESQDFKLGAAVAFGVERRKLNHMTTFWAQTFEIKPEQ